MRFRLYPTPGQEPGMVEHCSHARFVWNLALEQANLYRPAFGPTPNWVERSRQLTEARAAFPWLAAGSVVAQHQALRDFEQAMKNWWGGSHRRPTWRKAGIHEGFRMIGVQPNHVRRLNRRWAVVMIPKVGWVRFRWTRQIPPAKSYRVTKDSAGRWHIGFPIIPPKVVGPGTGEVVGVDRGVACSAALSTGELHHAPKVDRAKRARLQRRMASQAKGSKRRDRTKVAVARCMAHEADARKDWAEKLSTDLAQRFDLIRFEALNVKGMTRSPRGTLERPGRNVRAKAGLNREILASGWGLLLRRCQDKGTVELVDPAFTSQTCSACKITDREARESQAVFRCRACGHAEHADVNAARNIAARHAVTGRGAIPKAAGARVGGALASSRQPQLAALG